MITLKSVVLPAPFGPMRPVIEPSPTESVQPPSASTPPKRLVILVTVRSSAVAGSPVARDHIRFPEARGVAQPGSAPALGAGGRRFKSGHPDHTYAGPGRASVPVLCPSASARLVFLASEICDAAPGGVGPRGHPSVHARRRTGARRFGPRDDDRGLVNEPRHGRARHEGVRGFQPRGAPP